MVKLIAPCAALLGVFFIGAMSPARASEASQVTATQLIGSMDGHAYFEGSQNRTARPGCASLTRWAIDLSTPAGQAILAILISGMATGKTFYVAGQNTCVFDSELVYAVMVAN